MTTKGFIVLCATPMGGHVQPITAVGAHLVSRGWRVAMVTGSRFAEQVTAAGLEHVALSGEADFDEKDPSTFTPDLDRYRGLRLSRYQVEQTFIRPITAQAATLENVLASNTVSAVLTDGTFAGTLPLLSRERRLRPPVIGLGVMPLAQTSCDVAPTNSGMRPMAGPLGNLRNRLAHRAVRHVLFRPTQRMAQHRVQEAGGRVTGFVLDFSAQCDRFLQLGPAEFEYARSDLAPNTAFAGPVISVRSRPVPQPSWWNDMLQDPRPVIHVTQGTLDNYDFTQLVQPTLAALAESPVQIVVTTGGAPADELIGLAPPNARIAEYLDYEQLLPRTALMVTNGGFGGVMTALRHGVPLVVAPGGEDKPEVAARVGHFHVGINLRTRRPSRAEIRDAVDAVLTDTTYTDSAAAMRTAIGTYTPLALIERELQAHALREPTTTPVPTTGAARSGLTPHQLQSTPGTTHTEENPTMSDARAVIDQHITAFNDRTPDTEPWADEAEMVTPGATFTGREDVLGFLSVFQQAFSGGTLRIHTAVIDGNNASVEGTFEGVHDGVLQNPSGPVEATGKPVTFRWSATYLVNGTQLMSEHLYFDQLDFLGQLGLLPR